ncbi:WhiB family transcriptional regulator [Ornithinimicrobium pratense]|uniref:Transcriptional regulator WhiB n=1 Tax=Ornithinimicrobium pratense TaxID=2593973 RepID=A0A5J6V672_9MICO|nr:WhiB family transcriptional regulator [Ornithinimicrobium pratense]QFG68533.1 WhiB family transcriptional regulator [Ornithinimicrobium pratense]
MTAHSTLDRTPTSDLSAVPYEPSAEGPGEWWQRAACRDRNAELFFHADHERGPSRAVRTAKAKAVCGTCPVIVQCLAYALGNREPYGIWGGLDEQERARLVRRRVS